jgi:3-oxoadipate enol-lactonase
MPTASLEGVQLHYRIDGPVDGRIDAPWLVLCNSLGTTLAMWDAQVTAFARHLRVLRYDRRGHGASSTPPGPYTAADLGDDVLALMNHLGLAQAAFCGLSIGGLTGQWLALHAPERFTRFVLCSTAARIGTEDGWRARVEQVRRLGMPEVARGTMQRWFTPGFVAREPSLVEALRAQVEHTPAEGYVGCIGALIEADFRERLGAIDRPLLAIAGQSDPVTPPADLHFIARRVPGARAVELPGAHLCNVESAAAFTDVVLDFLRS